jgi:hypothetical protein
MARGLSGRLVIEVDPNFKRNLHAALAADGITLKDWFLRRSRDYLMERQQPTLPGIPTLSVTHAPTRTPISEAPAATEKGPKQ